MAKSTNTRSKVPVNFEGNPVQLSQDEKIKILKIIDYLEKDKKNLPIWVQELIKNEQRTS